MRLTKWDKKAIVKAIMADVPKPDKAKRKQDIQDAIVKLMSPECRKVYRKTPKALATKYLGDLIYDGNTWHGDRSIFCGDVNPKQIDEIIKKYEEEDQAIASANRKLTGAVEACSTLKQLNERLPEFKKYFPTEENTTANLPALANVVADLSKLGWPKGENK